MNPRISIKKATLVGLTTAMVFGGLVSGGSPALAFSDETDTARAASTSLTGKLVSKLTSQFGSMKFSAQGNLSGYRYSTLAAAEADSETFTIPSPGTTGPVVHENGQCLTATDFPKLAACNGTPAQRWAVDPDGELRPSAGGRLATYTNHAADPFWVEYRASSSTSSATMLALDHMMAGLEVKVESTNAHERTATLSGRATPNSRVVIGGSFEVSVDANGNWRHTLTNLPLGSFAVTVKSYVGGLIAGEQDIEISLALSRITADFSFSHANSAQGTITGTGEPGATIEVTRAGSLIASAEVSWNGNFSVRTPAPNKGGVDKIDVLQRSQGTVGPNTVQLTPDYGEPVSITSPADGTVTSDGTILLEGRGVPGGDLTLSNTTGGGEVASTVVSASGSWSVDVADLPSGAVEVEASVRGRGDNVTSAKVTIHREDAPVEALEVLTPAEGETVPSGTVTFTGTANAGAKVQLVSNQAGAILGEGTADATGNWTADVNRELGVGDYKIIVRNGSTDVIRSFTVKKPVVETLKVTAPAENSVVAPGTVTFTGTANAGAKVQLVSNQ
ncbi:Ig-like domain-containing protein, partial [Leucobacter aridicollis]